MPKSELEKQIGAIQDQLSRAIADCKDYPFVRTSVIDELQEQLTTLVAEAQELALEADSKTYNPEPKVKDLLVLVYSNGYFLTESTVLDSDELYVDVDVSITDIWNLVSIWKIAGLIAPAWLSLAGSTLYALTPRGKAVAERFIDENNRGSVYDHAVH